MARVTILVAFLVGLGAFAWLFLVPPSLWHSEAIVPVKSESPLACAELVAPKLGATILPGSSPAFVKLQASSHGRPINGDLHLSGTPGSGKARLQMVGRAEWPSKSAQPPNFPVSTVMKDFADAITQACSGF